MSKLLRELNITIDKDQEWIFEAAALYYLGLCRPRNSCDAFILRYGLSGKSPKTYNQVAEIYNVPIHRIRDSTVRSLWKLKSKYFIETYLLGIGLNLTLNFKSWHWASQYKYYEEWSKNV